MNYNKSSQDIHSGNTTRPQSGSPKTPRKHNIWLTATVSARSFGASYMGCDYDSNHHDHITFLGITLTSDHTTDQCYTVKQKSNLASTANGTMFLNHHNCSIYRHLPHPTTWGVPANVSAHIKSQGQAARHSKHYRTSQATTTTACHQRRTRTTAEATDAQGATPLCQSLPQHQPANQQPNASTATSMRRPETIATSTQRKPAGLKQNLPPYNALQKIQQLPHTRAIPQQI